MSRLDIPLDEPEFLPVEVAILHALMEKHEQYIAQGRDLEARGMARAAHIAWSMLKGEFLDTQPSEWGEL
jgi:hypothetical protein